MECFAVITGATSGIGYDLACECAKDGYSLIVVGRRKKILEELKNDLEKAYSINVIIYDGDLTALENCKKLFEFIDNQKINISIFINNAGVGLCGYFYDTNIEKEKNIIDLNITALTYLCKEYISYCIKNDIKGSILNVASTGAYQPGPLISVYYASKAYVLSFTEALREELSPLGFKISALCPGATKTEFGINAGKGDLKNSMSSKKVAFIGYKNFKKGKGVIIPGFFNKIAVCFTRIIPRNISGKLVKIAQAKAMSLK